MINNKILLVRPFKKQDNLSKNQYILPNNWVNHTNKKIKNKIISQYFLSENLIKKRLSEIFKNYCSLILLLSESLNKIHDVNFSKRYWEILLGPWLFRFLCLFSYNFYNLKSILKKNPNIKIETLNTNNFSFVTKETGGIFDATKNLDWFYNLNSLIIENFKLSNKVQKFINQKEFNDTESNSLFFKVKKIPYQNKIFFRLIIFFLKLFRKDNDALIIDTYLSKKINILLNLSFNQVPQFWEYKEIKYKKYDRPTREKINIKKFPNDNQFSKLIKKIITRFVPICFIESYNQMQNYSKHFGFPSKPKFILTSSGFLNNEILKFYIANSTEKGVKYFLGQHGNNYFTDKQSKFFPEVRTCDYFITWGKNKGSFKKKCLTAFNFITAEKKRTYSYKGFFTFFLRSASEFQSQFFDRFTEGLKGYSDFAKIINNLNPSSREKVLIRLPHTHKNKKDFFFNKFFEKDKLLRYLNIDDFKLNKKELFKVSSIHIHMYDSTGFLECISLNYPTICYLPGGFQMLENNVKKTYYKLLKHKIIFVDPTKLSRHLNFLNLNTHLKEWWEDKSLQKELEIFKNNFCIMSNNNSHKKIKKIILSKIN